MLWISWTNQDAILTMLVDDADTYLNSMLNIDGFDEGEYTERVEIKNTAQLNIYNRIYLRNFNISEILEINGKAYTGTYGVHYSIEKWRELLIRDIFGYLNSNLQTSNVLYFQFFSVKYKAWFAVIPSDVEMMSRLLVCGLYHEKFPMGYMAQTDGITSSEHISQYRLWDELVSMKIGWSFVSFKDQSDANQFQQLFAKYKKWNIL